MSDVVNGWRTGIVEEIYDGRVFIRCEGRTVMISLYEVPGVHLGDPVVVSSGSTPLALRGQYQLIG